MITSLKTISEQVCANDLQIDVQFLRKKWTYPYNPKLHLFQINPNTNEFECKWVLDPQLWEKLLKCYCNWFLISEKTFMYDLISLFSQTTEFWDNENTNFRTWFFKLSRSLSKNV
jgi:hypothetical protein